MGRVIRTSVVRMSVYPKGESPIYGEGVTFVDLVDEGAGPFVELSQPSLDGERRVRLEGRELLAVVDAAKLLLRGLDNG